MGTHNVHRTNELLAWAAEHGPITEILEEAVIDDHALFPSALPARRETSYNAWVTIQIGCDNTCAYCIVPSVRGKEISRPFTDIVSEVASLAAQGITEVTLLGQNVNSYGRDLSLAARREGADVSASPQFAQLLREVGAVEGIRRVRYTSPHPKDMRIDVLEAMAQTAAVCEQLHYPLQSGSDRVLSLMHRGYTADRYLERLAEARRLMPDIAVTSDIIVGFPGETEADFVRTMEVAAEADFDSVFEFIFSPREGTEAALMVEKFCDPAEVGDRFDRLRVVVERSASASVLAVSKKSLLTGRASKTRASCRAVRVSSNWCISPCHSLCAPEHIAVLKSKTRQRITSRVILSRSCTRPRTRFVFLLRRHSS